MRLLEPINGIKSSQGHYLMNLIFFIAMCTIDTNVVTNIHEAPGEDNEVSEHSSRLMPIFQNDYLELNSGAAPEHESAGPMESKEHELTIFRMMYWTHISSFVIILTTFILKKRECFNLKQFLQFGLLSWYFLITWYMVYITKKNIHTWEEDINEVRVWLFIESSYVFRWIFSSMFFVTSAHVFKFQSSVMSDDDLLVDDDPWNDRNSNDFLRYMKHDFFTFVYICTHLFNNLYYAFNEYNLTHLMGPRDKNTTKLCL